MSGKRILGITAFGILFIFAVISVMMLISYLRPEGGTLKLPEPTETTGDPVEVEPDALNRVEITPETVQAVVSTLTRPETYSRELIIESFWDGGQTVFSIGTAVYGVMTSLRISPQVGNEKRIIVTPDTLYIWYGGDSTPFIGGPGLTGDGYRTADEYQMLASYEDIAKLSVDDIVDAGYTQFEGEDCIYIEHFTKELGYTVKYYVSIRLGLITGSEEFDKTGKLVYSMRAGECRIGEIDPEMFTLPNGVDLMHPD